MHAYEIVIPPPWIHLSLVGHGHAESGLMSLVEKSIGELPKSIPPDQVGPLRRSLEQKIGRAMSQARQSGGIDLFLPSEVWQGFHNGSSFLIAEVEPEVRPPADVTAENYAPLIMAEMLEQPGSTAVHTANSVWVRTEHIHPPGTAEDVDVPTVSVDYLTPAPNSPGTWIGVMFSTLGDGNPQSDQTRLAIGLFDAIMSTWGWVDA